MSEDKTQPEASTATAPPPAVRIREYLTVKEAAEFLGVTASTLNQWRIKDGFPKYPRFRKHGRKVLYDPADLREWSALQRRESTSQTAEQAHEQRGAA